MSIRDHRSSATGAALGLFATTGQVILLREALSVAGGNELTVGLGLFSWLLTVGLGALAARRFSPRGSGLPAFAMLGGLGLTAALFLLRRHRWILGTEPGVDPGIGAIALVIFCGAALGALPVGYVFTAAAGRYSRDRAGAAGRLFAAEAFGAAVAGVLFAFVLGPRFDHVSLLLASAGILLVATLLGLERRGPLFAAIAAAVIAVPILLEVGVRVDEAAARAAYRDLGAPGEMVARKSTRYADVVIGDMDGQYHVFSDGRMIAAFPDPYDRPTQVHLTLLEHPSPGRVLLVGGGAPDLLAAALAHRVDRVVMTHLDEEAHRLMEPFFDEETRAALDDPRVTLVAGDGRRFVETTGERFDAIVLSGPPPGSARENRYHTVEFFGAVRRILRDGGIVSTTAPGGANVLVGEAAVSAATERATLAAVFGEVLPVPGIRTVLLAGAASDSLTSDTTVLDARLGARSILPSRFSVARIEDALSESRRKNLDEQLRRGGEINSDGRPTLFLTNLRLWERSLGEGAARERGGVAYTVEHAAWILLGLPLIVCFAALLRARRTGGSAPSAALSMGFTGLAGMGAEVALLTAYGTWCGELYSGLALLVALFMAGLGAGAVLGEFLAKRLGSRVSATAGDVSVVLLLLGMALVLSRPSSRELLALLSALAGAVTGTAFPALLRSGREKGDLEEGAMAGVLEASDHLGAAFGAIAVSVGWLPLFGLRGACLLLAGIKLTTAAASLLIGRITPRTKAH